MSNLTDLLPAGGGGKGVDFVASGALSNGSTVVLKADGTVEVVAESSTSITESIPAGSEYVFKTGSASYRRIAYNPNNADEFVIISKNSSTSGTAIIGTVSGTSISFSSEFTFASGQNIFYLALSFDPSTSGSFVIIYRGTNSSAITAITATLSAGSITFGTESTAYAPSMAWPSVAFNPNTAGQFVVACQSQSTGRSYVGSISGTSISFGSNYTFLSGSYVYDGCVSFDASSTDKFLITYKHGSNDNGYGIIGVVSGASSITYGSPALFNAGSVTLGSSVFIDSKCIVPYKDSDTSQYGIACVGTVSGSTISWGGEYVFNSGDTRYIATNTDTVAKFVVVFMDQGDNEHNKAVVGSINGTAISWGSTTELQPGRGTEHGISFDPNNNGKFAVIYDDSWNGGAGTAIIGQLGATITTTNLTSDNFLGISDAAVSDTATGTITLKGGISTNQSGLTIGSDYYVQDDGTLSTTVSSVKAGRALSATTLKLTGE